MRESAARLSELDPMIQRAGPGGTIYLLADAGPYTIAHQIAVRHGGTSGHPVTVRGVTRNGAPAQAVIAGTRTRPYPATRAAYAQMQAGALSLISTPRS